MDKVGIIKKGELDLVELLEDLMKSSEKGSFGAVVTFIGVVRSKDRKGYELKSLIYDADKEKAVESIRKIRNELLEKYDDLKELYIYHVIDELKPGEPTVFILAAAGHRNDAFKACREAIDRVKVEAPIWKKEVSIKSEHWIIGNEIVEVD